MSDRRGHGAVSGLPQAIVLTLRRLIRRARLVIAVRGVAAIAAAAVASLLAVMSADAGVTIFSPGVRYCLTGAALGITVLAMLWFLARPLARSLTLAGVARAIEANRPDLQERISSAVELLGTDDSPELRGSQALIAALVQKASEDVHMIRPGREITFRPARPFLIAAGATCAVLAGLLLAWPGPAARLLVRAVAPYRNLPNVFASDVTVAPGDAVVTVGRVLRVEVTVAARAVRSAEIRVPTPTGPEKVEAMAQVFDPSGQSRRFAFAFPPAAESFRYRIHAGDALTRYYDVNVVPVPGITSMDLRYDYPPYTGLEPRAEERSAGDISAVVGTLVTVTAKTNTSVRSADFLVNGQPVPDCQATLSAAPDGTTTCTCAVRLTPQLQGLWRPAITDAYGFTNGSQEHGLKVIRDEGPTVTIVHPEEKEVRLKPTDQLPILYAAGDDFGLAGADIVLESDGGELAPVPLRRADEGGTPGRAAAGAAALDLAGLNLRNATRVTFRLRAWDTLPAELGGPQVALSEPRTIVLDLAAPAYSSLLQTALEDDIRKALQQALAELGKAKGQSEEVLRATGEPGTVSEATAARVDQMLQHLDAAEGTVRGLAAEVAGSTYAVLSPPLTALADEHIDRAADLGGQLRLSEDRQQRSELADESDFQIDMAALSVAELLKEFEELAQAVRRYQELAQMAQSEAALAEAKAAMEQAAAGQPGQTSMTPQQWLLSQQALARDTAATLLKAIQGTLGQQGAPDLAERARQLQQAQTALARDTRVLGSFEENKSGLLKAAEEQEKLAREAAAEEASSDQAPPMAQAAEDIRSFDLDAAIPKQEAAATALGSRAKQLAQEVKATELVSRAETLAKQQADLAASAAKAEQPVQPAGTEVSDEARRAALAQTQQSLSDQAAQLVKEAAGASPQVRGLSENYNPLPQMNKAAKGFIVQSGSEGAKASVEAADRAGKLAEGLRKAVDGLAPMKDRQQSAQRVSDFANRQAELLQRTRSLAAARARTIPELESVALARLQREQAEVAHEVALAAQRTRAVAPQPDRLEFQAARASASAARRIQQAQLAPAAESAAEAAQRLDGLAERLEQETPPAEPEEAGSQGEEGIEATATPGARLAPQVGALASRQERLAREMAAMAGHDYEDLASSGQQGLAERTADLGGDVEGASSRLQELVPDEAAQREAQRAMEALTQAEELQGQAARAVGEGQTAQAIPTQGRSASALGTAAEALSRMAQRYPAAAAARNDRWALPASQSSDRAALAGAAQAADEAARTQQAAAAARAAQRLQAAYQQAEAQARQMGLAPFSPLGYVAGMAGYGLPESGRRGPIAPIPPDLLLPEAEQMEVTLDNWARLPGQLRDEILQTAGDDSPREYRALIKQYFQAIARSGSVKGSEGKP